MRFISVLLILGGLALAFVPAIYRTDHAGDAVAQLRLFDRAGGGWRDGWRNGDVPLTADGGPYRIRLEGALLPGTANLPPQLPVYIELTGAGAVVFSGEFAFATREEGQSSGANAPHLAVSLPQFDVLEDGRYALSARLLTDNDINLATLDARIVGSAPAAGFDTLPAGLGMFGFGTLLYLIAARRRKKTGEPKHRWGRG
ncbi:MAG: hypothetical protein KDJ80_00490 [Nitratireductor sp.]|nr:hypothetical protein [Nitratireductor sp.]